LSKIKITCDSTCDLTQELYDKYNVHVLPLGVSLGDKLHRDGVDVKAEQVFEFVGSSGQLPKTSALSIGEYEEVFKKYVDEGCDVIHISLSAELSASHNNARLAAEELGHVHVVDSRSLSSGSGQLVIMAAELADAGKSAEEIVGVLEEKKQLLDVSFVLQTLEYLHKGGRCSGVAAFGANALKLRPEIQVMEGKMGVGKKYRGDMEKSIMQYVRGRLENQDNVDCGRIFITHSGVPADIVEKVRKLVKELHPFEEVIETKAGCTISSHCGPNCLGVLFFRKN